jgi:hypothetical protein
MCKINFRLGEERMGGGLFEKGVVNEIFLKLPNFNLLFVGANAAKSQYGRSATFC